MKALEVAGRDLAREELFEAIEAMTDNTDLFGHNLSCGPDDHKGVEESVLLQVQNGRRVTLSESISYGCGSVPP